MQDISTIKISWGREGVIRGEKMTIKSPEKGNNEKQFGKC